MSTSLFVGNLSFRTTEQELESLFSNYGEVTAVRIIKDRNSGRSKGFGFVEMEDAVAASTAIEQLNGREVSGRVIRVNEAQPKPENNREGRTGGRFARPQRRNMDSSRSFRSRE